MSNLKVFGHKPPDTDTVCSPIVYAWYLTNKKNTPATAYALGELNRETAFVLKKFNIENPEVIKKLSEKDRVVILDTTNPDELVEGIDKAEIVEIIDHHKLAGGLSTPAPIRITVRPVACTATIIWNLMKQDGNTDIPKEMAGLMISSILSDTLEFTSPTTTDKDKQAAKELAKIAKVDMKSLASDMFEAKSDLSGLSAKKIVLVDSKTYDLKGRKSLISVLETTKPSNVLNQKEKLIKAMDEVKREENLNIIMFFAIDILGSNADLIVPGKKETEIAEKAFNVEIKDNQIHLPGIISRKKQIIPSIEKALS